MPTLDLGVIGNCSIAALVDFRARILWSCCPRFDGEPTFCALVYSPSEGEEAPDTQTGLFAIDLEGFVRAETSYLPNTAVMSTVLHDDRGNAVEIIDFAPRFTDHGRMFRPPQLVRRVVPIAGRPRIKVRLRPRFDYGATKPDMTRGSNHIRFVSAHQALRLTTTAPVSYILEERVFVVDRPLVFFFGSDERMQADIERTAREFLDRTIDHWRGWVRSLSIPFEWQEAVIRAAITLKLCNYEETGAIVAALTTSIPEAEGTQRNWDYRYCWLRDAYFVIHALNRLGATRTMEDYIGFINDAVDDSANDRLRPLYSITRESNLDEWVADSLAGYRGHAPVRIGNAAHLQVQNDVYGSVVLASTHAFFDKRLIRTGDEVLFERLEELGLRAVAAFDQPDAGPWELRNTIQVHTFSSLMCWAACDRLAKIATGLGRSERAQFWRAQADRLHDVLSTRAWNDDLQSFVSTFDGKDLDASLLLIGELGFHSNTHERFRSTVQLVQKKLCWDELLFRYIAEDDFGHPKSAFLICSFWLVDALHALGKKDEARQLFEVLLSYRNALGLLSEDVDPKTGELWGNFPQTYSMVGLINSAVRLSRRWEEVL